MMKRLVIAALVVGAAPGLPPVHGQSVDERLDDERYLRELDSLGLPELIDRFLLMDVGGDPVAAAERKIEFLHDRAQSAPVEGGARKQAINRVLELRAELIEDYPDHRHRVIWLIEQALDAWTELAAIDSAELAALVGLPTAAQREQAGRAARIGFEAARRAEVAVREVLLEIESSPGYEEKLPLQLERRRLAEQERDRRIPFLLGIMATLHAELNLKEGEARERAFRLAEDALRSMLERVQGPLADRARFYLGWSLMRQGELDAAGEHFRALRSGENVDRTAEYYATFAEVRRLAAEHGQGAALNELARIEQRLREESRPLYQRLLVADNRFRLRRQQALALAGEARNEAMARAFGSYLSLLDEGFDLPPESLRSVVFSRLLAAVDDDTPLTALPPVVTIARAAQLVDVGTEAEAAEAMRLLDSILDERAIDPREAALALWTHGRASRAANQSLDAARSYLRLARDHPQTRESEQAITLGLALAAESMSRQPDAARTLVREGLELLFERYPNLPAIDVWRLWAARLALTEGRLDEAIDHAERVTPDAASWLDARMLRIEALRAKLDASGDRAAAAGDARDLKDAVLETRAALERARIAGERSEAELESLAGELLHHEAYGHFAIGETDHALEIIESIDADATPQALLLRFRVLEAAGRLEEAHAALDTFLERAPDRAEATFMPMVSALRDRVELLRRQGQTERADRVAEDELFPISERFEAWLARSDDVAGNLPQFYLLAESFRLAGACSRALMIYERLLESHPSAAQFLLGRAECLFQLGGDHLAEAMLVYRRLAGAQRDENETFWRSQLRMLQILDRTGRNTHQILPQIHRLRERDRELGGARFRPEFERLQNKYADLQP